MVKRGSKLGVHGAREDYSVNTGIFDAFRNFEKKKLQFQKLSSLILDLDYHDFILASEKKMVINKLPL